MITDPLSLAALVTAATALAFLLDRKVAALSKVGASLLAILIGALLSNTGVVPVNSDVYAVITGPITSLAVAWLLLSVNLADVRRAGPRMIGAFGLAVAGTALGAFVAALLFGGVFGDDMWRLAGTLTGTYSGGSLNFAAVGREVGLPNDLFAGTAAADNLTTGLWLGATLLLPVWLGRFYPTPIPGVAPEQEGDRWWVKDDPHGAGDGNPDSRAPHGVGTRGAEASERPSTGDARSRLITARETIHPFDQRAGVSAVDLAILFAVGVGLLLVSDLVAAVIPAVPSILWLTTLALVAGHTPWLRKLRGAFQMGTLALHLFFVVIGIFSRVSEILAVGVEVFWLTLLVVGVHGTFVFGVGRLLRMDVGTLAVASQAAVGGPSSALAVAVSREWRALVLPGIVVGLLGYALGNYAGLGVAYLVRALS